MPEDDGNDFPGRRPRRVRWTPAEDLLLLAAVRASWANRHILSWAYVEMYMFNRGSNRKANQAYSRYARIKPPPWRIDVVPVPEPGVAQGVPVAFGFEVHAYINLN